MNLVRVLLVDDHVLVRAGIRTLLEKLPLVQVVGEAGDGHEALKQIKSQTPNIVLMDIAMSGLNGLEAAARVIKEFSQIKVIILSMHATEEYVLQALRAGASGYMLKDAAIVELELAIQSVSRGETYLSPSISKRVVESYLDRSVQTESPLGHLTSRQREILQLIAEGKTTKEIAFLLNVSAKTVETHRAQLMDRLDIHDVPGLVRFAMRVGLLASDR
jgi:DNA-binding NarL/FixJ family response regulator